MFGVVALRVQGVRGPVPIDTVVAGKLDSPRLERAAASLRLTEAWPDGAAPPFVQYGVPLAAVAAVGGLAAMAWMRRDRGAVALCLLGPALALVLTDGVLKPLVDRRLHLGLAYPSGHTAGAASVAVVILVLAHRWKGWAGLALAAPVALSLPAAMGLALIRLDWHYPTDVVGGAAVGSATVLALAAAVGNGRRRNPSWSVDRG